jgi:hypothetical protein
MVLENGPDQRQADFHQHGLAADGARLARRNATLT